MVVVRPVDRRGRINVVRVDLFKQVCVLGPHFYLSFVLELVCTLHEVFDPSGEVLFRIDYAIVEARGQVLHLEEALVDERLSLPCVDVLPNEGVDDQFK